MTTYNDARILKKTVSVFILSEAILFPLIQLTTGDVSDYFSYLAIVFVALFVLFACECRSEEWFIRLGVLLTLLADYFLVLSEDAELRGVISFIAVQAAYFTYLEIREKRSIVRRANVVVRISLSVALVVVAYAVLGDELDALSVVSVIYYANLLSNIIFAYLLGRGERLLLVGLVLFAACDLCIGLEVLFSSYFNSSALEFFYGDNLNLPWVFYQPSQVLIALSLFFRNNK